MLMFRNDLKLFLMIREFIIIISLWLLNNWFWGVKMNKERNNIVYSDFKNENNYKWLNYN